MPNVLNPSLSNTPSYKGEESRPGLTPYAEDLLKRGQAYTNATTPVYGGQLTTGPSSYQNQAWRGLANLTVPRNITEAGNTLGDIAAQQQNLFYTPGSISNTYSAAGGNYNPINATSSYNAAVANYNPSNITNAYNPAAGNYNPLNVTNSYVAAGQNYGPSNITSGYNPAVGNYAASNIGNVYDASVGNYSASNITNTYNPAAGAYKQYDVQTDTFDRDQALQYMNPYIEAALNPQLDLQQRRAAINQQADMAKLAQAGAFGGSRQAILQGLNQENLLRQQAETAGAGYEKAYTNAQSQFNADQARKMDAVRLNIDQAKKAADLGMSDAQLMAQYGMTAQQANESSRQFAQTQRMTAADRAAQYSLEAQKANEASRQFGKSQEMSAADRAAQFGLTAQQANEASRQFAQTQRMTDAERAAQYGMDATKINVQQAQKAADLGMSDAQLMAQYGMDSQKANELSRQFAQAQQMTAADRAAQYGMDATRANIQQAQKAADLGMSDAQLMAQYGMDAQRANEASRQFGATYRQAGLSNAAGAAQARAAAGANEAQYGLQNLAALSAAGAQQQELEQAALNAQYKDWLRQTDYPGKQLDMQKGLISSLAPYMPKSEVAYGQKQSGLQQLAGGAAGLKKLAQDFGVNSLSDLAKVFDTSVDSLKRVFGITAASSAGYADDEFSLAAEGGLAGMLHKMRGKK